MTTHRQLLTTFFPSELHSVGIVIECGRIDRTFRQKEELMSTWRNETGNVRIFGNYSLKRPPKEPSYQEKDVGVNDLLVKLGKRPAEPLPDYEVCPFCGSRFIHKTVNRVKCQGASCGKIIVQREPVPAPAKVDGTPE